MRFSLPILSRCWPKSLSSVITLSFLYSGLAVVAFSQEVCAQNLPEAADIGRIPTVPQRTLPYSAPNHHNLVPAYSLPSAMPDGANQIHLDLKEINIDGATAFTQAEMSKIYAPYVGKNITLDVVYDIAAKITALYRDAGYFLSMAYVPNQKIKNGIVHIKVIEGYIGNIESEDKKLESLSVVQSYIRDLKKYHPLKSSEMESFLLRINDLPGYTFRAILAPMPGAEDGAVKLTLVPAPKAGHGFLGIDNFSSRFMGPQQLSAFYETSIIPLQQTSISGVAGAPTERLKYLTLGHSIVIAQDLKLNLNGNVTRSQPGYTLEALDVKSKSNYLGIGLEWQYMRQRMENASFSILLDSHNTSIDFLNTPFTRDHVRALRLKANYDGDWGGDGYNWVELTLSHGLSMLGSSKQGDDNLSREQAKPDFTKAELTVSRFQRLPRDLSLMVRATGQLASGPLYSSEEFGYGGQTFGRAYDSSEITGDRGVSGAAELQYAGLKSYKGFNFSPYLFYDIGVVWNDDVGQARHQSGASSGLGMRIQAPAEVSFNFGLAFPLTRQIETPIYGGRKDGPRLFLQLTKEF
jgi:hemolysin activation/secretion protein